MDINRMITDLRDGETTLYADTPDQYAAFAAWLHSNGAEFKYHFEVGEGYSYRGRIIEVYGL